MLGPLPNKMSSAARKWSRRKHEPETALSIWDIGHHQIDNGVCSADEWLLHKSNSIVIENPHPKMAVRCYNANCIHS